MAGRVWSVCVFCFICATHSPCASHAAVVHEDDGQISHVYDPGNAPLIIQTISSRERLKSNNNIRYKRNSDDDNSNLNAIITSEDVADKNYFLKKIFAKYGNGDTITMDGFEAFLNHLVQLQVLSTDFKNVPSVSHNSETSNVNSTRSNSTCLVNEGLKALLQPAAANASIGFDVMEAACPAILYSVLSGECSSNHHDHLDAISASMRDSNLYIWLYSICAVIVISACGVLSLVIIPVMQKKFYKPLLQFLVALAVGTLAGDALLHLLPHAMSTTHDHGHGHEENHENMWKGFVAMLGLILFFIVERFIPLVHRWRKGKPSKEHSHVKVLSGGCNSTKETQCMDKYNAYPRCYRDIVDDPNTTFLGNDETTSSQYDFLNNSKKSSKQKCVHDRGDSAQLEAINTKDNDKNVNSYLNKNSLSFETNQNMSDSNCGEAHKMLHRPERDREADYTVIISEHGAVHHGHSHVHGHVHSAPQNLSSVAWMVIMGDGLHNFTDGMAIGAAFSGSIAGGFSTAVAVFCHELPHELGDFAMLLKAGMSIKEALFYNIISSILCILGNVLGIWLGNTEYASSWVFAVAAGTFIYIALVDMIPELSSAHEDEGNFIQCILHLSGLLLGFGVMTLIALYEHDLKNMFNE